MDNTGNDIDQRLIDYSQEYTGIDSTHREYSNTQELQDTELNELTSKHRKR